MKSKILALLAFAAIAMVLGASDAAAQDPAKVGTDVYNCKFENERVRVCEVTFKPGAKIATHSHPDHVIYIVSGGKLKITGPDGKAEDTNFTPGQVLFLPATTHSGVNVGPTEIKAVVFELKEPAPKKT